PIKAQTDDDRAKDKEFVRACEQFIDEIKHILEDEAIRDQPELLADNIQEAIASYEDENDELKEDGEMKMEDELSIMTPPKDEKSLDDLRSAGKIRVSMSDL
ncbi:hypothetical protein LCGC14_2483730, partial [marine sediment metagenome]